MDKTEAYNTVFDKVDMETIDCDGMEINDSLLNQVNMRSCSAKGFFSYMSILSDVEADSTSFKESTFCISKVLNMKLTKSSVAGMILKGTYAPDLEAMPGVTIDSFQEIPTLMYDQDDPDDPKLDDESSNDG